MTPSSFLLPLALLPGLTLDAPWPDYRGPGRDGDARGAALPATWSETQNVRWKTAVHGRGWSSAVVMDGRAWLTTATPEGDQLSILAVDVATGEVVVDRVLFTVAKPEKRNALNSYASPSPTAGDGRVYVSFGTYGIACLSGATGETLWARRDLVCDHMEGPGSSPLLHGGLVYLHVDGGDVQYIVALDATTGEVVWKTQRSAELAPLAPDVRKAYSTPIVAKSQRGRDELVSSGAQATYGYDPRTGAELWRVRHKGYSMSSRPILVGDTVIVTTGFDRPELWALQLGGDGDVTGTHVRWRNTRGGPTMPSPVIVDGLPFQSSDRGMASCIDTATGETLWQERRGADVCASLLAADGRIMAFDRDGKVTMFAPERAFKRLGEARLERGFMASPAVVGGALILRTETHLYRIEASD